MTRIPKTSTRSPNLTPMVDVVMCILIFFMLASAFVSPELALAAPVSKRSSNTTDTSVELPSVSAILAIKHTNDSLSLVGLGLNLPLSNLEKGQLLEALQNKRAQVSNSATLFIQPDTAVRYQDVITVYDACIQAGFSKVVFVSAR